MDAIETVKGLRELADFIEQHPDLNWSYVGARCGTVVDTGEDLAAFAATGGKWDKDAYDTGTGGNFALRRKFGPVELSVLASRDQVCERKVVGVEVVEIPDPDAPRVTVEREVVEWTCAPVLAKAQA